MNVIINIFRGEEMKIKEICVENRKRIGTQVYSIGLTAELEKDDNEMEKARELQAKSRKLINEQMILDKLM